MYHINRHLFRRLCSQILFIILILPATGHANGVAPYVPISASPLLEHEIERLAAITNIPDLTKPYNLATVFFYLDKVKDSHPVLYRRLSTSLDRYGKRAAITYLKLEAADGTTNRPIPNSRGSLSHYNGHLSVRAHWQMADWLGLYLGGEAWYYSKNHIDENGREVDVPNKTQASGSMVSVGTQWAQLDIGYKDYWYSPFQSTAQLISTNAKTMTSISLSNNLPIDLFGLNINYEMFIAEMSRQPVKYNKTFTRGDNPFLAGVHVSFQPTPWWTLGGSRMFQFGGGERPTSLSTLGRAFIDPRGTDNDAPEDDESGNQIAAIASRMNFDGKVPFSLSLEFAGEDTSNNKPHQLGNSATTAGIYFPYFFSENLAINYEQSSWQARWYVNTLYEEGYTNDGQVLGNWAYQTLTDLGTPIEGSSQFFKAQWQTHFDHIISARYRTHKYNHETLDEAWQVDIDYHFPWQRNYLTAGINRGTDALGEDFWQLRISFHWE